VAAHGQLYICRDTRQDHFTEGRLSSAEYLRSYIALPLRNRGHTHGAFILKSKTPYFYGDSDGSVLLPIVDQMAIALANFRLFEQVERGRRQLQAVLDSTDDAVLATDAAGHLTLVNPAAERLFRVDASRALGQPVWEQIKLPELTDFFRQALEGKFSEPTGIDVPFRADRFLFADFAPMLDGRSSLLGWMAVVRDITHFKRLDALKSETIATVAHDLKSPLHLVSGALGVLAEDAALLANDQREALNIAQSGLRRMRLLIDDLLDLKKIEEGFGIVKRDCPVDAVLRSVVSEAMAAAAARSQTLSLDLPRTLPVMQADPERLHQAFANLVGNAVKYTQPGGEIQVRAWATGSTIEVVISDNGPGISSEDQIHIFEKFFRARHARRNVEGTGMGLAIVKSIVEQHGGKVIVQSVTDRGTQFVVSLPVSG
jgi:two-component system phosphate regulon sensor histidine kinase PhoR